MHAHQRYAPPPPKPVLAVYDRRSRPPSSRAAESSSASSIATTQSSSAASAKSHGKSISGSRRGGSSSNRSAGSSSAASHTSTSSSLAGRTDEDDRRSIKRGTSFVKLKRSASTMSMKMKRKFSGKSTFEAALAHGSSSQLHVPMPDSLHNYTASSSTTNLSSTLSSHFGSGSTSYSSAQISPSGAYKIAEALLASGSPSLAIPHLHQAAANGHVKAQYTIGVIHTHGVPGNLRPDLRLASTYYRLAALAGYPPAQCNLGVMYAEGQGGLPRDILAAREWFRKSAEGGYPEGMWNLARTAWQCGDLKDARRWFARAGESGCAGAERYLKVLKTEREADRHYADVWKASPLREEQVGEPLPRNIRSKRHGGWGPPHPVDSRRQAAVSS